MENPIVFSGEIYRFKPGIQNNFIPRWFQISTHAFRYFKNYYSSHGTSKPLVAVPNAAILKIVPFTSINKEAFFVGKRKNAELERRLMDNMFEVVLHHDYESIYLYREIDAHMNSGQGNHSSRLTGRYGKKDMNQLADLVAAEQEQKRVSYKPSQTGFLLKSSRMDLSSTINDLQPKSSAKSDCKR